MTGSKIAITFDTHAGNAASNTDLLRGHAIILNTPVSLPRTAFHSSHLCSSTICFRFHTLEYKGIKGGGEDRSGSLPAVGRCSHTSGAYPGTSMKLLEVEGVRGSRPCYPRVTDAVTCPSCPGNTPPSARSGSFNPGKECRQPLGNPDGESIGPDLGRALFRQLLKLDGTCPWRCPPGAPPPGRHRHRGGPSQSERFRAGVNLPVVEERLSQETMAGVWGLGGWQSGECFGLIKKTAVEPVEPVGGVCPSKEVWETLR